MQNVQILTLVALDLITLLGTLTNFFFLVFGEKTLTNFSLAFVVFNIGGSIEVTLKFLTPKIWFCSWKQWLEN